MTGDTNGSAYDIAIIGGGVNGCGIARDAAGRGWSVFLCEANDLASGTSSASTKLIHGGLRYLENYEFRLVRESLREREVLWGIAPHLIRPLRFVLPAHSGIRPAWLLRLGLFLYDHLGGREKLPPTRSVPLRHDPAGRVLQPRFTRAFAYSDCWVDDSRLVISNARDAANKGAVIRPRMRCIDGQRLGDLWVLTLQHTQSGEQSVIRARTLVNATGPWVSEVLGGVLHSPTRPPMRLVKGSHIVVRRLYPEDHCYIFQNADGRVVFVIPYENDFTLIGTTDCDYSGDPAQARASADEIAYLCQTVSTYLATPVTPAQVIWSYSGVRPLYDGGTKKAQEAPRDYVLELDAPDGQPALLSIFGGKLTTFRKLGEAALALLAPHLPPPTGRAAGWTGRESLPGGDFSTDGFPALLAAARQRHPQITETSLYRLLRAYGSELDAVLDGSRRVLGADLTETEIRYLVRHEWAMTVDDIVWRRGKLGLRLSNDELRDVAALLEILRLENQPA